VSPSSVSPAPRRAGALRRHAGLYGLFLVNRLKILMEYRVNFLIGASSTFVEQGARILAVWVVMSQVPALKGWSFDAVLLIYGLATLARSFEHMFADNLWTIGRAYIRTGDFDRFLVRPVDPLFHLLADRFNHDGIGNFLVGAALVVKASLSLGIAWTALKLLVLVVSVLSGGLIFIALNLLTASSAFWIVESVPVTRAVHEMHEFAKYPLTMYARPITGLLTWVIPYGFASFYPAAYLLGREGGGLAWLAPVVAAALTALAYGVWTVGLRRYAGTGS
jgi:ABC-2 type transport system permease protein